MDPLRYWKALTDWKSKEISWLDQVHGKNPRYREAKFRRVCDAFDILQRLEYNWIGPVTNLCSPGDHTQTSLIPSSLSQLPSSHTSRPTPTVPDMAGVPPHLAQKTRSLNRLWSNHHQGG